MKDLQLTSLLIDQVPTWRPKVGTACQVIGVEYSEGLLYKVTYELSDKVQLDTETMELTYAISDDELFAEILVYTPPEALTLFCRSLRRTGGSSDGSRCSLAVTRRSNAVKKIIRPA